MIWIDDHLRLIIGAVALIVVVAFIVFTLSVVSAANQPLVAVEQNLQRIQRLQQRQDEAIYSACQRLNILRATDNESHYTDYQFFSLTARLLTASLAHPTRPMTPHERRVTVQYANKLQADANNKSWIPLTNCQIAERDPTKLLIPRPIPFSDVKHPPSTDALHPVPPYSASPN
jgi:hypothetical protein